MSKRRFSQSEKKAVEIVSDSVGEADHVDPYSKGGSTSVENCQIVPAGVNRRKGAFQFKPRKWQQEFFRKWDERDRHKPFMLIAIPGGGKTMASLEVARRWMAAGADRRVIVVVPTVNLQEQWKDEAVKFGIQLQTKEFGTRFKDGFKGCVSTYHLVANQPLVFRKLCSVAPTLVIFDEIHHCGEEAHFGVGIKTAFELSDEKLLMSGTPWKSDGTAIPFVKYDGNGYAVADFPYDYPRALNEDVVRYLVFEHSRGAITNDVTGEVEELSQEVSEKDAQKRLGRLLDATGGYVRHQIEIAHRKLMEVRGRIPDAAALAACKDQYHAMKVAQVIREVTGCEPSVIVSNSDLENDSVKRFRNSKKEWLVAVRKVSEGTDIKRLQVLCYLTNTTAELFFRQLVGRVSRVRGIEDFEAYVYLPSDPRLIKCAENIENAQVQALREQSEKDSRELDERQQGTLEFDTYSTEHGGTDLVFIAGERLPESEAKRVEQISESTGVSMQKVMAILAQADGLVVRPKAVEPGRVEVPKEDRMNAMRSKINSTAFRLSKLLDIDVKEVHGRFKRQSTMTEGELRRKLDVLIRECKKASR